LSFLDVLVQRSDNGFIRSVFRKPTFTGLLTTWDSFCSSSYKLAVVNNMFSRAKRICSPSTLLNELDNVNTLLRKNGYPMTVIDKCRRRAQSLKEPTIGPKRSRVVLRLPWLGSISKFIVTQIKSIVSRCYYSVASQPTVFLKSYINSNAAIARCGMLVGQSYA